MHHPIILAELKCEQDDIVDFELNVCDTQNSQIGGATNEFIFSGRLDNLYSSFFFLPIFPDNGKINRPRLVNVFGILACLS